MLSILARRCEVGVRNSLNFIQKRNFLLAKRVSEKKYKIKDKVDEAWTLIYKAPMEHYLAVCTHITTISGALLIAFSAHQFSKRHEKADTEKKPYDLIGGRVLMAESDVKYFAIAFVAFNLVLRYMSYQYPVRIYKNGQKYLAILEGQIPTTKEKFEFIRGAVKEIPSKGYSILPWKDSRFKVNEKRNMIMLYESFKTPSELFEMLKKPIKPRKYAESPPPF